MDYKVVRTVESRGATIGLPYVKVLESSIWEIRPTAQIRLLTAWIHEERLAVLLEADRKKNGRVDAAVVERAQRNLAEWHVTRSSDPLEGL
jgi:hypothetical protein